MPAMATRPILLPLMSIATATAACGYLAFLPAQSFGASSPSLHSAPTSGLAGPAGSLRLGRRKATTRSASGGDAATAEEDSVQISGFAAFVVGLALLPHMVHAITIAFGVATGGEFVLGLYGIQLISCVTSLCVACWSLGSFIERGKGLPAGPLGLLGLSEGLSYLAALGLLIAVVVSGTRTSPSTPSSLKSSTTYASSTSYKAAPSVKAPDVPNFKAPELPSFKAPDFKLPDIKVPEFKVPEFKAPDIKVPEFKVPEFKAPDFNFPEIKVPEVKLPEVKPAEIKQPEVKKALGVTPKPSPAPVPAPAAKTPSTDYGDLFD